MEQTDQAKTWLDGALDYLKSTEPVLLTELLLPPNLETLQSSRSRRYQPAVVDATPSCIWKDPFLLYLSLLELL